MPAPSVPLDAIRQPAILYDPDGRIVAANDLAEARAGRSLAGMTPAEFITHFVVRTGDGAPLTPAALPSARSLSGEAVIGEPLIITTAHDPTVRVLATASPIRDGETVTGALVVWEDAAGEQHRTSAEGGTELETAFAASPIGLCLFDRDLRFIRVNRRFAELNGISAEAHLGRSIREAMPSLADTLEAIASSVLETGTEVRDVRIEGEPPGEGGPRHVITHWAPIRAPDGEIVGVSVAVMDVTSEVLAWTVASESGRRYRELVESANSAIIRWSRDGILTYANEYAEALFGYGPGGMVGLNADDLLPEQETTGADPSALVAEILAAPEERTVNVNENVRADGSRLWMVWTNRPIYDERGEVAEILAVGTDISAERRGEQALAESEARLVEAQRLAQVGNWEWDIPKDEVVWSRETYALFGRNPDLPAPGFVEEQSRYYTPVSWARLSEAVQAALEAGEPYDLVVEVIHEDGDHRWLAARGEAVLGADGLVTRLRGTVQDITERKRAEAALRESEEHHRRLFETMLQGVVYQDADGRIVAMNPAAEGILGKSPTELLNLTSVDTEHDTLRGDGTPFPGLEHPAMVALRTGEEVRDVVMGVYNPREEGYRWISITAVPLFREGEAAPYQVYTLFDDVTQRREAAAALAESEALLSRVLELSLDGIYRRDLVTGRYEYANPALASITGYSLDELKRMDLDAIRECVHPDGRQYARDVLGTPGGWSGMGEYQFRCRDGTYRWLSEHVAMEAGEDGRPRSVTGVIRDVTERRANEEALREYAENLRRSNEDLEQFAYVSSHDLQEPLRSIVSFSQLLERRYKGQLGEDADEYIEFIVEGGNRMQTLILDLLAYSRVNSKAQEIRPTDVEVVMASVERQLDLQLCEADAMLTYDPLPVVTADPIQLEQVFVNLVSNAIKFRRRDVPLRIHVGARRLNGFREFSVQDNGIGIEAEYLDQIFVIFKRLHTKDAYPGTGIGLAIVKRIVDCHGGTCRVESTPGEGSTFYFTLPAA